MWWALGLIVVAIYCVARAFLDFRQKQWVWAAIGILSAAIVLFSPIPTHAVKVELTVPDTGK